MRRKTVLVLAASLVVLWPFAAGAHRHRPNELVGSFVECWNKGDAECVVGLFEENGDYYQPFGSYASGRADIRRLLVASRFGELGRLELEPRALQERFFQTAQVHIDWRARLVSGDGVRAYLLLSATLVPTLVTRAGEIQEFSFRSLRLIQERPAEVK